MIYKMLLCTLMTLSLFGCGGASDAATTQEQSNTLPHDEANDYDTPPVFHNTTVGLPPLPQN